jgi:hypothetical protein
MRAPPYLLVEEPHPETGQKLFKLEINRRFPPTINAGVGAVINSVRSSLDLLAASLALRNGKTPNADRHFSICRTDLDFIDPLAVRERKKWFSEREISITEGLKPYDGGDPLLFALHHLDVTRKHERLVSVHLIPTSVIVDPRAHAQGLRFPNIWPGFKDGAVIAWASIKASTSSFRFPQRYSSMKEVPSQTLPCFRRWSSSAGVQIGSFSTLRRHEMTGFGRRMRRRHARRPRIVGKTEGGKRRPIAQARRSPRQGSCGLRRESRTGLSAQRWMHTVSICAFILSPTWAR